jgi:hypothetical protein
METLRYFHLYLEGEMLIRKLRFLFFVGIASVVAGQASASEYVFDFDTIVSGDVPGGSDIATMTIADFATDSVLITLEHNSTSADGQFISSLWLNLDPFVAVTQSDQDPLNKFDGSLISGVDSITNAGLTFDLQQNFQTANSGGGANRLKPGESVSFLLTGSGLDAADFLSTALPQGGGSSDIIAMIHLQGLANGSSVKLGTTGENFPSVPEPASMGALAIGAAALIRKRKRR